VEALALHFERHAVSSVDQVNSPDPAIVIAEIDPGCHRTLPGSDQYFVDAVLEPALRRPEAHRPFGGQLAHQRGDTKAVDVRDMTIIERGARSDPAELVAGRRASPATKEIDRVEPETWDVPDGNRRLPAERSVTSDVQQCRLSIRERVVGC
jgi:hypothetical protein